MLLASIIRTCSNYLIDYILPTEDLEDLNLIKSKYEYIEEYNFKLSLMIISFLLISLGLLSSTLHLGHPERAWRSFSAYQQ